MIVIAECVVAVIVMRLRELLIENFLLIGGQHAAESGQGPARRGYGADGRNPDAPALL